MTFPGAGAQVYYNEAGEPLGWDSPQYDEGPDPDDFDEFESDDYEICDECGEEFDDGDTAGLEQHRRDDHGLNG